MRRKLFVGKGNEIKRQCAEGTWKGWLPCLHAYRKDRHGIVVVSSRGGPVSHLQTGSPPLTGGTLPSAHETCSPGPPGVECGERRKDEFWAARETSEGG